MTDSHPVFVFGVPLLPRERSRDWQAALQWLDQCVASMLNQTDPRFRVVVASNEPLSIAQDPRVENIVVDRGRPGYPVDDSMLDKGIKLQAIGIRLRELGGGALMKVDHDDLVSRRIVAYVHDHPEIDAFIFSRGMEYLPDRKRLRFAPFFDHSCGSCAVVRYRLGDLADSLDVAEERLPLLRAPHQLLRKRNRALGRRVANMPFVAALHRLHGANHSIVNWDVGVKRRIMRMLIPTTAISPARCAEFSIRP